MKTPSHAILNFTAFSLLAPPEVAGPILFGAVLPDLPIFGLYFWGKVIKRHEESYIWNDLYHQKIWQTWVAAFHSFVITGGLLAIAFYLQIPWFIYGAASMVLHNVGDFPVHHHDAHRHFYPVSSYRFHSPLSYWDRRYYGREVANVENACVIVACGFIGFSAPTLWLQGIAVAVGLLYCVFLYYAFGNVCTHPSPKTQSVDSSVVSDSL